jgi:hypothetical protein
LTSANGPVQETQAFESSLEATQDDGKTCLRSHCDS